MGIAVINTETGEILADRGDGLHYSTTASRKRRDEYYERQRIIENVRSCNNDLGGFIFAVYEIGKEFNRNSEVLTQADLTRLVFIGTYTNFDGVLMETQKSYMSKKVLQDLIKLSRNKFNEFYRKLIGLGILEEVDGKILMDKRYFFKGTIEKHKSSFEYSCTRVYIKTVRGLYNNTPTSSHKALGLLYRIIPYLNVEWNIVCHNPTEKVDSFVKPMTLGEVAGKLGYSTQNVDKLKKELESIKTKEGNHVIVFATFEDDKRTYKIVVNPKVIYGGSDFKNVKGFTILFK